MSVWTALIIIEMVARRAWRTPLVGGGTGHHPPLRPLASSTTTAVPCCHRSTPPRLRPSDKWQTRREAGTQSHGPHAGSRVAEQEVDRGGPEIPGGTTRRTLGHHPRGGGCGAAQRSIQLPPLRIGGRRGTHMTGGRSFTPLSRPAPPAPRNRAAAPRAPSTARRVAS